MFIWLTFEDWPTFVAHVKDEVSPAWLFCWRMMINLSLSYLFSAESSFSSWKYAILQLFIVFQMTSWDHWCSGHMSVPCSDSGSELLHSMQAEALESYKLELSLSQLKAEHLAWLWWTAQCNRIRFSFEAVSAACLLLENRWITKVVMHFLEVWI